MKRKGLIDPVSLVVLAGICIIGVFGVKHFSGSSKPDTSPMTHVNEVKDKGEQKVKVVEVKIDFETKKQLDTAQAAIHATEVAIGKASEKNVSNDAKRELATAKEINEIAISAIDAGLNQPVDPKLMKWFIDSIDKKNSEILREREIGEKMLQSKQAEIIASADRESKLIQEKADIRSDYDKKLTKAEAERDEWARENAAKAQQLDNIYFWVFVAVGIWLFSIIAPIIGKVFPAFAPIAAVAGAVVAPMVAYGKAKADNLASDLVALNDKTKDFVANIDPAKVAEFKSHVKEWWGNDTSAQHEIENIKKSLRL